MDKIQLPWCSHSGISPLWRLKNSSYVVLFDGVLALLEKVDAPNRMWAAEKVIDALVGLGPNTGFWRSSQLIPQIISAVRRLGNTFNTGQVVRMVSRGESYSRAGFHGLAQLYDHWPDHARELNLPLAFRAAGVDTVAWYCAAREQYPELSSFDLWSAFAARRLPITRFGDVELAADDGLSDRLWSKWPNRGDSVLLDNLVWISEFPGTGRATRCKLKNRITRQLAVLR